MTESEWLQILRRLTASIKACDEAIVSLNAAWYASLDDGLANSLAPDAYLRTGLLMDELKAKRLERRELQARFDAHMAEVLHVWQPDEKPS